MPISPKSTSSLRPSFAADKIRRRRHHAGIDDAAGDGAEQLRHATGLNDRNVGAAPQSPFLERQIQCKIRRAAETRHADFFPFEILGRLNFRPRHQREHQRIDGIADHLQARASERSLDHGIGAEANELHIAADQRLSHH